MVRLGDAAVGAGKDTIEAVEVVVGSDDDDTLGGDGAANLIAGMHAAMTRSQAAAVGETLRGGRGDDTLHAGPGLNRLIGGPGVDRFVFDETSGDAVITDFASHRVDLTVFSFTRREFAQQVAIEGVRSWSTSAGS